MAEKPTDSDVRRFMVYLPPDLHRRLRIAALDARVSASKLVIDAIERYLASREEKDNRKRRGRR